jgi:hypothetical protein
MKTLKLWTFILTLFICGSSLSLVSCSIENEPVAPNASMNNQSEFTNQIVQRKTGLYPENAANDYDAVGQLYDAISEQYLVSGLISTSTAGTIQQVEGIANLSSEYQSIVPGTYTSPSATRIDYIVSNQQLSTADIIANSGMSAKAKSSLTAFLNTLMDYKSQGKGITEMYPFIVNYESNVIADSVLTATDRKVILSTTSISRYAFSFAGKHRRKPRDRDWDISWGNIVAGTEGSVDNSAKAIIMTAVAGIIANK